MTTSTATTPQQRCDIFTDLITDGLRACATLGVTPASVHADTWPPFPRDYSLRLHVSNPAAVDALAEVYGLDADDGETTNYHRQGTTVVAGHDIEVDVYCGRPTPAEVSA